MKGELTMKKAVLGILVLFMAVSLSACNTADTPNSYNEDVSRTIMEDHSSEENIIDESISAPISNEEVGGGNPNGECLNHCFSFHMIQQNEILILTKSAVFYISCICFSV